MPLQLTVVPAGTGRNARIPLEDTDPDVKQAVDEAYVFCQTSDDRLSADLGTEANADKFLAACRDYAYAATPRLVVTGNSTKKGLARFRVTLYVVPSPDGDAA
jgi:hypothetical protein